MENKGRKLDKNLSLRRHEFMPRNLTKMAVQEFQLSANHELLKYVKLKRRSFLFSLFDLLSGNLKTARHLIEILKSGQYLYFF